MPKVRTKSTSASSATKGVGKSKGKGKAKAKVPSTLPPADTSDSRDNYVFFWKPNEVHGWASQWYRSPFTVAIPCGPPDDSGNRTNEEHTFQTAEHWMMAQKALLFSDYDTLHTILSITSTDHSSLARVKSLGRQVTPFDDKVWNEKRLGIVIEGNLWKFRGDGELRGKLEGTGERELVEASPRDRIWGIGFGEKNAIGRGRAAWGLNLLGKALMEVRRTLREEEGKEGVRSGVDEGTVDS
ncbi:hypothetical protein JAAARDRAFT_42890 [Jaapia argillacea MUCL 33604]|uniref:NADAR domain-containing protein n=1 Tax=Jaapia argillacea MUCL 33604 TaxID=933084 RepID=A0A067P3K0_9AGAM|nr:hypothetical protein JAAARDRAFT_42890 [Jaapia argillacea MUCL 33604]